MTLSNIDTFEHDIEHEMKSKEVTVRDIATSRGDIGNEHPIEQPKTNPLIYIAIVVFFLAFASVGGYFGYTYYMDKQTVAQAQAQAAALPIVKTTADLLKDISPDFPDTIGRYVSKVEKKQEGYVISITSYAPVFAYLIKNESVFADRVAYVLGVEKGVQGDLLNPTLTPTTTQPTTISIVAQEIDIATTTSTSTKKTAPPPAKKTTLNVATSTATSTLATKTIATTTPVDATTTVPVPVEKDMTPIPFTFTDVTISNQNMRMAESGNARFYYAFIQNKAVVFSNSSDGILKLRDAILR